MKNNRVPYVCGPLTELPSNIQKSVKRFYSAIGDLCGEILGTRAFAPHERYDPIKYPEFTPEEIDKAERKQVCKKTSILIVVAIAPSWRGGIEVEMANRSGVPIIILCQKGKKISRLLRGNPAVRSIVYYESYKDALKKLKNALSLSFCQSVVDDYNRRRRA